MENEDYSFVGWDDDGVYIDILDNNQFESNETIIVSMTKGEKVNIGQADTHTITIEDDDVNTGTNLKIDLAWDAGSGTPGDVDMDLILFKYDPIGDVFDLVEASASFGTTFESLTLNANDEDATYGVTYQYYEGTSNNLEFTVTFVTTTGSIDGTEKELSFSETYTLANVNSSLDVFIEQLFIKEGTDYNTFSAIDVPVSGSRMKPLSIPMVKKQKNASTQIKSQKMQGKR